MALLQGVVGLNFLIPICKKLMLIYPFQDVIKF